MPSHHVYMCSTRTHAPTYLDHTLYRCICGKVKKNTQQRRVTTVHGTASHLLGPQVLQVSELDPMLDHQPELANHFAPTTRPLAHQHRIGEPLCTPSHMGSSLRGLVVVRAGDDGARARVQQGPHYTVHECIRARRGGCMAEAPPWRASRPAGSSWLLSGQTKSALALGRRGKRMRLRTERRGLVRVGREPPRGLCAL